ncbi:IS3 family transposase [Marinobacterium stanieri]|uniref:IS3 family transposase n=1 Tax=Marinobacterium stanieri TaxID=49186 RepID=UPI001ED9541A|nr:IS3 family transposase [Marinobacterium stanieri]
MQEYRGQYAIRLMCRVLDVSASGFYRWLGRGLSARVRRRQIMEEQVMDTFATYKARYGAPRIAKELNALGIPCSVNYVANILKYNGTRARNGKAFKYTPHTEAMTGVAENLLKRRFNADGPNQKWTTDITYIWVRDRWLYLATVMDLYSRSIVGWSLDTHMTEQLITDALNMAFKRRDIEPGLIIHSDRGVQYRSNRYQTLMEQHGCKPSMSRKGNCWDNAVMESFFSRLKVELIYAEQYRTIDEAKSGIFEYIEVFYNRIRRHSALGYVSPAEYERKCA